MIGEVISALSATNGAWLARMSGSGATCFAIYENTAEAQRAAQKIQRDHPLVGACGVLNYLRAAVWRAPSVWVSSRPHFAGRGEALQCDLARQNATTCSSAVFIGEAGNSASASTAIAP